MYGGRKRRANLSLGKDRQKDARNVAPNTPRDDEQEGVHSVKTTRLNEDSEEGFVKSSDPALSSHRGTNVPAVWHKSGEEDGSEENTEPGGNREVWKSDFGG